MTPILTADVDAELTCSIGFMRMLLDGALKDALLYGSAIGASQDTKAAWARRAAAIRPLLAQLPPPANPRDPFDDIPGEPTPEEAAAMWRERAEAEDAREAARRAPMKDYTEDLIVGPIPGMLEPPVPSDLEDFL